MDLDAANRALVEENALVQQKLLKSLELLEQYQDHLSTSSTGPEGP